MIRSPRFLPFIHPIILRRTFQSGRLQVLGGHNGMIIEYDPTTLAPLGMVVSRDELLNREVAVIDDGWGGDALILFDKETTDVTVVQVRGRLTQAALPFL